jgi:hypothetical protein
MATIKKAVPKAQKGKTLKPNYSNIRAGGFDYLKTPTAKDSSDYRKGFDKKVKGEDLKQYPSPTGAEIRGYNEASKRIKKSTPKKKMKNGGSLSGLTASNKRVGPVDPKGAFTKVQKKALAGAKGKASLTKDKQLGATKMAKRGMKISKNK